MSTLLPDGAAELEQFHRVCLDLGRQCTPVEVLQTLLASVLPLSGAAAGTVRVERFALDGIDIPATPNDDNCITVRSGESVRSGDTGEDEANDELALPLRTEKQTLGLLRLHHFKTSPPERALLIVGLLCEQAAQRLLALVEESVKCQADNYKPVLAGFPAPACVCDGEGRISAANPAFGDLLGQPTTHLIGLNAGELLKALPHYEQLSAHHEASAQLIEFRFSDPPRFFHAHRVILDDGRQVYSLHDITETKRLRAQFQHIEKLAALGELIGGITHELNNPLATIIGYAQLLETDETVPPRAQRGLGHMHAEAQRASQIVGSLRAFAGRSSAEKSAIDINELLHSLGQMKVSQLSDDDIQLLEELADGLPAVWGDAPQLQQLFLNIINNAAQAMRDEPVRIEHPRVLQMSTQLAPRSEGDPRRIRIEFADTGTGIDKADLERIFEPFYTTKPLGGGVGLGLSLATEIVAAHGGSIRAESEPGSGARFIIELPTMPPSPTGTSQQPLNKDSSVELATPAAILVVGETSTSLAPLVEALAELYEVSSCDSAAEATVLLAGGDYDLIVAAIEAPRDAEPSFFEYLQTIPLDLLPQLLFVVDRNVPPAVREFLTATEAPILTAPIEPEVLCGLVRQIVEDGP